MASPSARPNGTQVDSSDTAALRIAFVCGPDRKFITDIEREISKIHEVRTAYFEETFNLREIQAVMDWADVTWFEWTYKILAQASNRLRKSSRVVTRLHRWEAFQDVIHRINWSFVDTLIPTTNHIVEVAKKRIPRIDEMVDIETISSTVDPNRFQFREREPGYDVAYVGHLNYRKNPSLLLQCLHALVHKDERYQLHMAGDFQHSVIEVYFEHMLDELDLREHVQIDGWVDDMPAWLDNKRYLILTSLHEGNPYSVLEAAAMGVRPLVHTFPGADELYPDSWTFASPSEFAEKVLNEDYTPSEYRDHVVNRFSLTEQVRDIASLFSDYEKTYALPPSDSVFNTNAYYGHESILKEYAGLPHSAKLTGSIQHGYRLSPVPDGNADPDLPEDASVHMFWSGDVRDRFKELSEGAIAIGAPFLYLQKLYQPEPSMTEGSLFFAAHSSVLDKVEYDISSTCDLLEQLDEEFRPITVCVYWTDLLSGHAKIYEERGFRVVSFGNRQDPNFLVRFLEEITRHDFSMSNQPTSALLYTASMGIKTIMIEDTLNAVSSNFDLKYFSNQLDKSCATFSKFFQSDIDIEQQRAFANRLLGKDQMLTKRELRSLLLRHTQ
jgi:glycosyltransferase involved in cell wall biosynthesis